MKRGIVVGEVWATRKAAGLIGQSLKLVVEAIPSADDQGNAVSGPDPLAYAPLVVAADTLNARNGQEVLVAYGSGARNVLSPGPHNRHLLCDAAIALLVDGSSQSSDDPSDDPRNDKGNT